MYLCEYECIIYVKNEMLLVVENFNKCVEFVNGDYMNFLLDDDLFYYEKIERMMKYFLMLENILFVMLYCELIDENGEILLFLILNMKIVKEIIFFEGKELGNYMLKNLKNVVGELIIVLFNWDLFDGKFGYFKGKVYFVINDIVIWLDMMRKGKVVYIYEFFSYFR